MAHFIDDFKPWCGDLLYGMAKARARYLEQYEANKDDIKKYGLITVVDDYNTLFYDIGNSPGKGKFTPQEIFNYMRHLRPMNAIKKDNPANVDVAKSYQTALFEHKRFSPYAAHKLRTPGSSAGAPKVAKEGFSNRSILPDSLGGDGGMTWEHAGYDVQALNLSFKAIRRACKFGVGFVADQMCKARPNARICFLLDRIRMEGAFQKDLKVGGWLGNENHPITYSELRYTFRHWARFKDRVKFYVLYDEVAPPWEEDWVLQDCFRMEQRALKANWLAYGKAVSDKHKGDGKYSEEEDNFLLGEL